MHVFNRHNNSTPTWHEFSAAVDDPGAQPSSEGLQVVTCDRWWWFLPPRKPAAMHKIVPQTRNAWCWPAHWPCSYQIVHHPHPCPLPWCCASSGCRSAPVLVAQSPQLSPREWWMQAGQAAEPMPGAPVFAGWFSEQNAGCAKKNHD